MEKLLPISIAKVLLARYLLGPPCQNRGVSVRHPEYFSSPAPGHPMSATSRTALLVSSRRKAQG